MGLSSYHVSEHIYLASEIGSDMNITRLEFATSTAVAQTYNNVSIYLRTTAATTQATGVYSTAGYTLVYSGALVLPASLGFSGVTLTTPFAYATAAGNLEMLVERTDNLAHAGITFVAAVGNATGNTVLSCRRYNSTVAPVSGTTTLTQTNFRATVKFIDAAGICAPAFPQNFSTPLSSFACYETNHPLYLNRSTANGFAVAGTGSAIFTCFSAGAGVNLTLTSPTFPAFGVPKQINFDVSGAEYTGNAADQLFLEASTDGGATWPITLASPG